MIRKHFWEIVLLLASLGAIIYYSIDWDSPKQKKVFLLNVNNQTMFVSQVIIEEIPQKIYDGISNNPQYKEYLLGNKKRVFMLTWDGCPYRVAFKNQVQKAFTIPAVHATYEQNIISTGQTFSYSCNSRDYNCPIAWVAKHCMGNICIINPKTREAIIDYSRNAKQIIPLLAAYASWDDQPLLTAN